MSNDTPFNAMMPPNTTLTSRTASSGAAEPAGRCASCACIIGSGLWPHGPAEPVRDRQDEGYLIPSTTRATFPPGFNRLVS